MISLVSYSFGQVAPMSTITHPLSIGRHAMASLSDAEAGDIIAYGSQVLAQCNAVFQQRGGVATVNTPSSINSDADMAAACSSKHISPEGGLEPKGTVRTVRVVNAINWCGTAGASIIGCAYTPGQCMVVVRYTHDQEGILWAHEFGHSKGLPHRSDSGDAVMYPSISPSHLAFTGSECSAIRQLGLYSERSSVQVRVERPVKRMSIEEFVSQVFVHGVPYEEARLYSSSDVSRVLPWLRDSNKMDYGSNIATTVGIVADSNAFSVLESVINADGADAIPVASYRARFGAIMAMGYVIRGSNDQRARDFLERHSSPSDWSETKWRAPYQATSAERDADLASAAVLGLSLAADSRALAFLQTRAAIGDTPYSRVVRQAVEDLGRELENQQLPRHSR
jgi:hypothetical protein